MTIPMASVQLIDKIPDYVTDGFWLIEFLPEHITQKSVLLKDVNLYAKSITIPSLNIKIDTNLDGSYVIGEQNTFDDITIELFDDKDGYMQKFIYWWFNCIIDLNSKRVKKNFRKETKLVTLTYYSIINGLFGKPSLKLCNNIFLGSCLPTSFTYATVQDESGIPLTYNLTLKCGTFKTSII